MSKQPSDKGPEFSREREYTVVLEELKSQFRTFGDGLDAVQERLGRIESDVAEIKEDVAIVKASVPRFEKRLTALEQAR